MQWSLVAVILIVNALFGASFASAENGKGQISTLFEAFGYSPSCVASALTSCEFSSTKELSIDVVDSIEATKSLLQEIKSEGKFSASVVKSLFQEMKSERENSVSEIKAIRQEIKSEEEKSSSVVKTLLQEVKSEIKLIRQELKSAVRQEMQSERENSASVLNSYLQEIKSAEKNSSSVLKSLLQEMQSEIGNSVSGMNDIRQEMRSDRENISKSLADMKSFLQEMKKEWKAITVENCAELLEFLGNETSSGGVQTVYPYGSLNPKQTTVYCDQVTDGGGWTVIQSRSPLPIRENFQRNWDEYVEGFGDLKGEFWLGLDNIHALTNSGKMQLRIDLEDAEGQKTWALYTTFRVGDAASKYVLRIGNYSGDAGDGMTYPSDEDYNLNGMKFSTFDNDNDLSLGNCAGKHKGGWWFNRCSIAHLNGLPIAGEDSNDKGIHWRPFHYRTHSMTKASMRIRPVSLGI